MTPKGEEPVESSTVRLRALAGTPLADVKVRGVVVSTAHAIAERTGVPLLEVVPTDDAITVTIGASRLAGLGFLAELRRITNAWFAGKHPGQSLWGEVDVKHDDEWTSGDDGGRHDSQDDHDDDGDDD